MTRELSTLSRFLFLVDNQAETLMLPCSHESPAAAGADSAIRASSSYLYQLVVLAYILVYLIYILDDMAAVAAYN